MNDLLAAAVEISVASDLPVIPEANQYSAGDVGAGFGEGGAAGN